MSLDLIVSGYPGLDHIMPVNRAPQPGETGVILRAPSLDTSTPGGCAPNIAVACARLGIKTAVAIVIGDDQDGKRLVEALEREGVNIQYGIHVIPGGHTAHTLGTYPSRKARRPSRRHPLGQSNTQSLDASRGTGDRCEIYEA